VSHPSLLRRFAPRNDGNGYFSTAAIVSFTSLASPLMSPLGSTLSPRRTITMCWDGRITIRWPRSPEAKNASRGIPRFTRAVAHAERIEQFAPRQRQCLLRPTDGIPDDARQDLRGRARIVPSRARSRDHSGVDGVGGAVVLQEHPARRIEAGIGFIQIEAR